MGREFLPLRINAAALLLWASLAILIGLAGRYLGGPLEVLRWIVLLIPLVSAGALVVSAAGLRYRQEFDNDHPVKGTVVGYRLVCTNEYPLPSCPLRLRLRLGRLHTATHSMLITLGRGETAVIERTVACPFRGVYTVGLAQMAITDPIGFCEYRLPVWHQTFYVTPRVLEPSSSLVTIARSVPGAAELDPHRGGDPSLFRQLGEYRGRQDARHIAWRYYPSRGLPLIREYDSARDPGVRIVLDTRPTGPPELPDYGCEDCSIEAAVALARACTAGGVPVSLEGYGVRHTTVAAYDEASLEAFVRISVGIFFAASGSPWSYVQSPETAGDGSSAGNDAALLIVTHLPDDEIIEWLESEPDAGRLGVVFNTSAMDWFKAEELRRFAGEVAALNRFCRAVDRADDLLEAEC